MKYLVLLFITFRFTCGSMAQTAYVPVDLTSVSQIKIELKTPLTITEMNAGYSTKDSTYLSYGIVGDYEIYNAIGYRLVNHELIDGFAKLDTSILFFYDSDLNMSTDSCRYIIRSQYFYVANEATYFVYDTKTKESFEHYKTVELLVESIRYALKFNPTKSVLATKSRQQLLNEAIDRNVFKERKGLSKGAKITLGVLAYGTFQTLTIILSNLD